SGFSYSAGEARLGFSPRVFPGDFRTFFSVASGWGTYAQRAVGRGVEVSLRVEFGSLRVKEIATSLVIPEDRTAQARVGRKRVAVRLGRRRGGAGFVFEKSVVVEAGETLRIRVG
ncbi:MAG: hypothetical protein MUQ65_17740, partial [Armatimonadetes bacterium]|nr:hypothetical protein [Armatimonadota bacterium]